MSRSPDRPTRARGARLAAALLGAAAGVAALAPGAQAAFTTQQCRGASISGQGASFQNTAQTNFAQNFGTVFCGGSGPTVDYNGSGSGAGRRSLGERTGTNSAGARATDTRFAATDEPLSSTGRSQIENGTEAPGDESAVHEIPVAVGSVAVIVHFPDGCDVNTLPPESVSDKGAADNTARVQFSKTQLEQIWAGDLTTWGQVFPDIKPIATTGGPDCANVPMVRVKRFDDSGTTFVFKSELNAINPRREWLTTFNTPDTTPWPKCPEPGRTTPPTGFPPGATCIDARKSGGGALAQTVSTTNGSIGYADLATSRDQGFSVTPTAAGATRDMTYWTKVPNGSGEFMDPAFNANSFKTQTNPVRGANCTQAAFRGVPTAPADPTLGDFSQTTAVDTAKGYGICTVTYDLAFDDNAKVYGLGGAEETKARTVKDYLTNVVGSGGQSVLFPNDYAPLPEPLATIARNGVAAIGFNKAGDAAIKPPPGGGTTPPGGGTTPPGGGGGTPSNKFTIVSISITKNGGIVLRIRVGTKGRLAISGSGRYRAGRKTKLLRSIGGISVLPRSGGTIRIGFRPASSLLKAAKKYGSVKLKLKIGYTPTGGSRRVAFKTVTFKVKSRSRR